MATFSALTVIAIDLTSQTWFPSLNGVHIPQRKRAGVRKCLAGLKKRKFLPRARAPIKTHANVFVYTARNFFRG
ncbi:phosphoribosylglycinamide formyltransferase 2, partial [Enterobacter cloacae]